MRLETLRTHSPCWPISDMVVRGLLGGAHCMGPLWLLLLRCHLAPCQVPSVPGDHLRGRDWLRCPMEDSMSHGWAFTWVCPDVPNLYHSLAVR